MLLRRRKSRSAQLADLLGTYLRLKAMSKAAKGARKAARGTAMYQVAKRAPVVRRIPFVAAGAGAGAAAFFATRRRRGGGEDAATA